MSTHPLLGDSANAERGIRRIGRCFWECRLCGTYGIAPDPAPRIRAHLAEAHGATTPTRVSTDVRDAPRSIYDRTR